MSRNIDPNEWRFKSMIDSVHRAVVHGGYSEDLAKSVILHMACRAFQMGIEEGAARHREPAVSVTDLSSIPELRNLVADRWADGRSN